MQAYQTVKAAAEAEFTEKRSRFLCLLAPVHSPEEAAALLSARRAQHRDARHTVFAYRLADGTERYSDDGEPQGTAGQPILEVLRRRALTEVCCAVTRYFGGILLGAGGLTRAYANGAVLAAGQAEIITVRPCVYCRLQTDYARYGSLLRLAEQCGAAVRDTAFAEGVTLSLSLPAERYTAFCEAVREGTNAAVAVEKTGEGME